MEAIFKNRQLNLTRLLAFGFQQHGGSYLYITQLPDARLCMAVTVTSEGAVSVKVTDPSTGEPYTLFQVPDAIGAFVGSVRKEYETVLGSIAEQCFDRDVFKGEYAKLVIRYAGEKYLDEPEFLWEKFPQNAIFRRKDSAKWYAALLHLSRRKLGFDSDEKIDILDLRGEAQSLVRLVDGIKYFPGYHMNKKHWFTICLDGSVPIEEIRARIDASYDMATKQRH